MIGKLWKFLFQTQKDNIGRRGEKLAANYLTENGYHILERNLTTKQGELDLVATTPDQKTVVFVEVKTSQKKNPYHLPEFRVNHQKQRQIINLAAYWCKQSKLGHLAIRFHVIGVNLPTDDKPQIRHHEAAFNSYV